METKEEKIQENKINSIGKILKEEREKAGLTQQQVSEVLKLRPGIIDAIEREQWDKLPHAVFVKGFIRSYARLLNIDLEEISEDYNNISPAESRSIDLPLEGENSRKKKVLWISLILVAIAVILVVVFYRSSLKKKTQILHKTKSTVLKPLNKVLAVYVKRPIHFPIVLKLKTKKRVWLNIAIDKYAPERYILEPGEYICWQVKESLELAAGDASGIKLWINNIPVNFKRKEGRILYLYLKKKKRGVDRI